MSTTIVTSIDLTAWQSEIQGLAQSGALASAVQSVYGVSAEPLRLETFIESLSRGEFSVLPAVSVLDAQTMQGHPGAYAAATDTIYVNATILGSQSILTEVLTHELGHFIADQFYPGHEAPASAQNLTRELLAENYALLLTGNEEDSHSHSASPTSSDTDHPSGQLVLPGAESTTEVKWFDTNLHIDWAKQKLPMLNAQAFAIFERAQNDSDAFTIMSAWGLQTDSATHFDNNNIRGGITTMRKRWTDGIERFESQSTPNITNSLGVTDTAYVARGNEGEIAGIANLVYRFGQISHAMQDFYSHSNWVELGRDGNGRWIAPQSLLDPGLDIPTQLNPGEYLQAHSHVMVAMSGPNYGQFLQRAGIGSYAGGSKVVNWWVELDSQYSWGKAFANPLNSSAEENQVIGLMSGAVNGAVYYDTDYSLPLRGVNRSGFFDKEYFRGFSHGGIAGTLTGQWVSPLAKDKADNTRFSNKSVNKSLYDQAQTLADSQLQNDWDRMGNLIYKTYGEAGLRRFANFAVVEADRDLYVSTYRVPGARWDWNSVNASADVSVVASFANVSAADSNAESSVPELETRYVEVFYQDSNSTLTSTANRTYVTQIDQEGRWVDSAAGLVHIHHDHDAEDLSALNEAAEVQYAELGGRGLWSSLIGDNDHYLGTTYHVQQINTQARVYINQFDIGVDVLQIVDAAGQVIETIDIDHGDFDQTREMLLQKYNIQVNARPELEAHTSAKVLIKADLGETVLLEASEFFADHDIVHGEAYNPDASQHSSLMFIGHDETLPWLSLRSDGVLEISNLSAIASGTYQTYVTVSDGAGLLEGVPITISIDPTVKIGDQTYSPEADVQVTFAQSLSGAISLYGQIYDLAGNAISGLEPLALRVGDSVGTPEGVDADIIDAKLANPTDHGTMQFFAYFNATQEMVMLTLDNLGGDQYALRHDGQVLASLVIGGEPTNQTSDQTNSVPNIDEFYIPAVQDSIIGLSLAPQTSHTEAKEPGRAYKVLLDTSVFSETLHQGGFGLLLIDLKTGHVVDPTTGLQIEDVALDVESVGDYAVYNADTPRDGENRVNATLLLDAQLNLNNLAFLPYYVAELTEGKTLFFGVGTGASGSGSQIVEAGQNIFAVEEVLGGDADFDDLLVRVDAMQVFHSDEVVDANDTTLAFDTGVVESLFADVTGFDYINGGQGFALSRAEDRDLFVNMERVQFQDRSATEYELRGSFAPTINFSAFKNGVQTVAKPVHYTGEASLNLHYQLIDGSANMEVAGSRLNDFIALQGEGDKSVEGGVGNDVMDGGKGESQLSGGLGRDTFFLDGRTFGSAATTVTDFELGQDRVTVWGWQTGLSRVTATQTTGSNPAEQSLTLYFENLLSSQLAEDPSVPTFQAMTLSGLNLSDFGVSSVRELNAQIASGSQSHFQTGTTVDAYGEHGYLYLS